MQKDPAECYALGLDPTEATNDFRIVSIEMLDNRWLSLSTLAFRQRKDGSRRRRSFKSPSKTPYQNKNAAKCVVFRHTSKKTRRILLNFCRTFVDRKSTDCAREFSV